MTLSLSCCRVDSAHHPLHWVRSCQLEWTQMLTLQTSRGTNGRTDDPIRTHPGFFTLYLLATDIPSVQIHRGGRCSCLSSWFPCAHSARIYEHMKVKWKIKDRASQHDKDIKKLCHPFFFSTLVLTKVLFYSFQVKCSSLLDFLWLWMFRHRRSKNSN